MFFNELPKILKNIRACIEITRNDAKDVEATKWRLDTMLKMMDFLLKASSLKEALEITSRTLNAISKK